MTTTNRIELTRNIEGEPMMSPAALALLFGVDAKTISDHMSAQLPVGGAGAVSCPAMWVKRGRRRSKEAAAATGSNDVFDILAYWAERDLGAVIEFEDGDQ